MRPEISGNLNFFPREKEYGFYDFKLGFITPRELNDEIVDGIHFLKKSLEIHKPLLNTKLVYMLIAE